MLWRQGQGLVLSRGCSARRTIFFITIDRRMLFIEDD
jgi:hypothetical protein